MNRVSTITTTCILGVALLLASCADPAPFFGSAYVYGVTDYGSPQNNLTYTDDDAIEMADLFSSAGYTTYLRLNNGTNADAEATVAQLETDINNFSASADESELFIFFFSGHGVQDDSNTSDIEEPADGDENDEFLVFYGYSSGMTSETWDGVVLSDDDLALMLAKIPGSRKLVIIDACYSGGFIGDSLYIDSTPGDYNEYDTSTGSIFSGTWSRYFGFSEESAADIASGNAYVLTAAGELESSLEDDMINDEIIENGLFTYAFLEGATSGDANGDGYITLGEIYEYICSCMDEWNESITTYNQYYPHLTGSAIDFVLF